MTARLFAGFGIWLAIGFSTPLRSDTVPAPIDSQTASRAEKAKTETPENAPEPKSPSCQDTCIAEGWDAEDCRQDCTWVADGSSLHRQNFNFAVAQNQSDLTAQQCL